MKIETIITLGSIFIAIAMLIFAILKTSSKRTPKP